MNNLTIVTFACILVQVFAKGFDFSSIFHWYQDHLQGLGSSFGLGDTGCDNTDERDPFQKFYSDVALIDMESSAGSMPHSRRDDYHGTHDEAYSNHDSTPDIAHLEHLVRAENMNAKCRMDILHLIERFEHVSAMTTTPKPTTPTTAGTTRHRHTHRPHTQAPHTSTPTTAKPTTPVLTNKPTTRAPIVTTPQPVVTGNQMCNQLTLVSDLAKTTLITHPLAGFCADGTRSESEALVLQSCTAPAPVQWRQGDHVLGNCANIPKFSPIATFLLGNYVMDGTSLSGILLDCHPNGFKMAAQICGHTPQIFDIIGGSADPRQNAESYYLIKW